MKTAFIFPGQGSQYVGMGKEFADNFSIAKETFQEVDEALGQNLSQLIFAGPAEELMQTQHAQAALMVTSMAIFRTLKAQLGVDLVRDCAFVAGHSLGEYTALAAAEALSLKDTAKLLQIRGNAMSKAAMGSKGAMAAIMADFNVCQDIAKQAAQNEICDIANYNSNNQIVLSGNDKAIDRALDLASIAKIKGIKLNVSGAFHSQLMTPAAIIMQEALNECDLHKPIVPIISNFSTQITQDPTLIKDLLVKQVTGMVRWYESILLLKEQGVVKIVEIGAGKVLTNLTKRIDKEIISINIQTIEDMEKYGA
jgi:[acyl-carrier-protein] S-malonyltransferase